MAAGSLESIRQNPILGKDTTAVKKPYHIVSREAKTASAAVEEFARANGQILLPLMELITQARMAVDEVIDSIGRQTIETILSLSAEQVAGPRTPGKSSGDIRWHGTQKGRVSLADRQIKVKRPRLRHKQKGEVGVPAYESLQENSATAQRMMGALLRGVSTREYAEVLPEMAETAGVSRSSISRQAIEGSVEQLRQLRERRWDQADLLVLYIDGQRFGSHHVISAVGMDRAGAKHVLGIELGATENSAAVKQLLTNLRDQGLPTDRIYLFVIDGAKALRAAIEEVFGAGQPVQRCRNHKMRNVIDELPKQQRPQAMNLMRAAWRVHDADEGIKRLEQLARFLEQEHESAARSLREGMAEMFTLQRLQLPPSLYKCLGTTNVIESPQSGVQKRTRNVTRWRDAGMVERWAASAWLLTEKHFRKVVGHRDLWTLAVALGREHKPNASSEKVT
ncbi:MAG: IS256 family transposase [Bryobacteraceae bacterium]